MSITYILKKKCEPSIRPLRAQPNDEKQNIFVGEVSGAYDFFIHCVTSRQHHIEKKRRKSGKKAATFQRTVNNGIECGNESVSENGKTDEIKKRRATHRITHENYQVSFMCVCDFFRSFRKKSEKANNWSEMKFCYVFKRHGKEMKLYLPADVCLTVASSAWQFFLCVKVMFVLSHSLCLAFYSSTNTHSLAPKHNCFPFHFPHLIAFSVDTIAFVDRNARCEWDGQRFGPNALQQYAIDICTDFAQINCHRYWRQT